MAKKVVNLIFEKDFLEGKLVSLVSSKERKALLDTKLELSLNKQRKLLHVSKSSLYYHPNKPFGADAEIKLLEAINNIYYIKREKGFVYLAAIIDWHVPKKYSHGNSPTQWMFH